MSTVLVILVFLVPIFVVVAVSRNEQVRRLRESGTVGVEVDDRGVRRILADGRREEVAWDEITAVEVFVARRGPFSEAGGAIVLEGDDQRGCIVPFDWLEPSGLLAAAWRLPAFDGRRLVAAMEAPAHRLSRCWERDPGTGPGGGT